MSRTYNLSATTYGGRTTSRSLYLNTMQAWAGGKRVGCWQSNGTDYYGAVSFYFDSDEIENLRSKTIESIKLTPICSGTFAYSEEVLYNTKSNASVTDWTIPNYAYEKTVPRYGVIPTLNMMPFGLPDYGYVIGGYYRTYAYCNITGGTLTVVTAETNKVITFNANGGSNPPSPQDIWGEGEWIGNITQDTPSWTGYRFTGWNTEANGSGDSYDSGDEIELDDDITLYAQWEALRSTIDDADDTEIGSSITVEWTNYGQFTNKIRFVFGSLDTGELSASGDSYTYAIPTTWNAELPNAVSGTATVYLYTYLDNTLLGIDSKTFVASVPASIVPSFSSLTSQMINDNQTVAAWGIYLQDYSKVKLIAAGGSAGQGATIVSYQFIGQNLNVTVQTDQATANATSDVIEVSGSLVYRVIITDSRGRTYQDTLTISVTAYSVPAVLSVTAVRSDANGTENPVTGMSINASSIFMWSQVGQNAITTSLSYKRHIDQSYTVAQTGISSGTTYVIAANLAQIAYSYDVKVEITDALNNSASFVVICPAVIGIGFGLKNDRARFGGPTERAGLQVDWESIFKDDVEILGDLNIGGSLTGGGVVKTVNNTAPDSSGNVNVGGGSGTVQTVNNVFPDQNGNVQLAASDVGALPDTYSAPVASVNGYTGVVQLGPADVGARFSMVYNLAAAGWYRIFECEDVVGAIIDFDLCVPDSGAVGANAAEIHKVSYFDIGGAKSIFSDEHSVGDTLLIDKIRRNYSVGPSQDKIAFDIHYTGSASHTVKVEYVLHGNLMHGQIEDKYLEAVDDAPSGESPWPIRELSQITEGDITSFLSVTKESGGSLVIDKAYRRGHMVAMDLKSTSSGSVSAGSNIFTGTINGLKPLCGTSVSGYNGARALSVNMNSSGGITVRYAAGSSALASGTTNTFHLNFLVE